MATIGYNNAAWIRVESPVVDTPPMQRAAADSVERDLLIDVSRLIWRLWSGRLPTGIDRVCLAYVQHFGDRARAVVQRKANRSVLGPALSDRLFAILTAGGPRFRARFLALLPHFAADLVTAPGYRGKVFLNMGHTGLNEPSLPKWIGAHALKPVYFVHDLIPIAHPEFCRSGEAEKHQRRMRNVLRTAVGVIGNSQATLDDLAAFANANGLPMPPTLVAWIAGLGRPEVARPATMQRPYFITIGTIEGRKNHILLLQIWRRLARELGSDTPYLVIVGQRGWEATHALEMLDHAPDLAPHVREFPQSEDAELTRMIAGARALLMPSFAEGFGLPVVEALQLGTPVIASDLRALREISGGVPTFLDPIDGKAWERTIRSFSDDSAERRRQLTLMSAYHPPNWATHFTRVEEWLVTL